MYLLIRYPGGIIVEGVLLAKGRNRLRVVAAGFPDAIELRRTGTAWFTAGRVAVELDFLMSDAHQSDRAPSTTACATMAAAISYVSN
jgi:hypothetical protein